MGLLRVPIINENNSKIQKKSIAFGRMVANAVMLLSVVNTTTGPNHRSTEGIKYSKNDLSMLSLEI
ncbi:hypothetical protein [Fluoribacter gormanii]|uniref:hypothetical protein n=1 Tax=Fluoribacter gormanii TaxID=464 RepID=UPI0010419515|nr:hypothetical protein [Fluoribacter gormanii]